MSAAQRRLTDTAMPRQVDRCSVISMTHQEMRLKIAELLSLNEQLNSTLLAERLSAELSTKARVDRLKVAIHELRQPLQTLVLLQARIAKLVAGNKAQLLQARFDEALGTLTDKINSVLDAGPAKADAMSRGADGALACSAALERSPATPPVSNAIGRAALDCAGGAVIFIVDDDQLLRKSLRGVLEDAGQTVEDFASCEDFLAAYRPGREACLLIDAYLPGMSGLELLQLLQNDGDRLPAIMITGNSDVAVAVQAMKSGASDFIEKPVRPADLLDGVKRAFAQSRNGNEAFAWREVAARHLAELTPRQRQIMDMVLAGHPSKIIAADLGISQRTVENHRAAIMRRTGAKSLPALARLAVVAAQESVLKPGKTASL